MCFVHHGQPESNIIAIQQLMCFVHHGNQRVYYSDSTAYVFCSPW